MKNRIIQVDMKRSWCSDLLKKNTKPSAISSELKSGEQIYQALFNMHSKSVKTQHNYTLKCKLSKIKYKLRQLEFAYQDKFRSYTVDSRPQPAPCGWHKCWTIFWGSLESTLTVKTKIYRISFFYLLLQIKGN